MKKDTYELKQVLEYTIFFNEKKELDIISVLKRYNRITLVKMAAVLSHHYGNFEMPNNGKTFFSEKSQKHIVYVNEVFENYYNKINLNKNNTVIVSTYRTALELWRLIFSIPVEEYSNTMPEEDEEFYLFKVILAINEKIFRFKKKTKKEIDELIFLNNFLNNDSNYYAYNEIMQSQMYYFYKLVNFIPQNEVMSRASDVLLSKWGITSWKQYYATILWLTKKTDEYFKNNQTGVPIVPLWNMMLNDETGLFSETLIESLCINEDDYISIEKVNTDYRQFRSKPFIKLKDGSGVIVINNQFLCERLYNSLYFDFMPLINGKKSSIGYFDYNKDFVEKVLFRETFFKCLNDNVVTWPARNIHNEKEDRHEPDFYARYPNGELLIMECKAIKMNGEIRDDADYDRLLAELHEKIVLKTRNIDSARKEFKKDPEPIGIGQIINHIDSIEDYTFKWDNGIPDQVAYYPIIVFEDVRLLQPGLMSILNKWFYEEIKKRKEIELKDIACMPIIPVSINTLYLYDDKIRNKELFRLIDEYLILYAKDQNDGSYAIEPISDFDAYLRRLPFNKKNDIAKWLKGE
jgi:hypothetical protein